MGWTVKDIARVGLSLGIEVDLEGKTGTHSYLVRRGKLLACLSKHHGPSTEIDDRSLKKMCKRLEVDCDALFERLRKE